LKNGLSQLRKLGMEWDLLKDYQKLFSRTDVRLDNLNENDYNGIVNVTKTT
jgi:hypothetical protein